MTVNATLNQERLALTGLRGIAALTVVIGHAGFSRFVPSFHWVDNSFRWYAPSVDLFFMLSGFVLCMRYTQPQPYTFKHYISARIARIFPLQWFVVMMLVSVEIVASLKRGAWDEEITVHDWLLQMILVQRWPLLGYEGEAWNPSSWSLSVEWLIYLSIAPMMITFLRRDTFARWPLWILLIIVMILLAAHTFSSINYGRPEAITHGVVRGTLGFVEGSLAFHCTQKMGLLFRRWSWCWVIPPLLCFAVAGHSGLDSRLLVPVCAVLLLVAIVSEGGGGLLECRPVVWLGNISYSLYLLHYPIIIHLLHRTGFRRWLAEQPAFIGWLGILAAFAVILAVSGFTYRWLEVPSRRWLISCLGRRLQRLSTEVNIIT